MGNKTVKRVGILLGITVLLGGTSFALWWFQVERKAQDVVARAEKAEEEGDYAKAAELYREYLTVKPSDVDVKIKYGDVLTKSDWAARQPELALEIYEGLVGQFPGREDVRRRAAEVAAELATRSGGNLFERARGHLAILLKTAPNDGHLEFLMGRCYEEDKEYDLRGEVLTGPRSSTAPRSGSKPRGGGRCCSTSWGGRTRPIGSSKRWSSPPPTTIASTWNADGTATGPTRRGAATASARR